MIRKLLFELKLEFWLIVKLLSVVRKWHPMFIFCSSVLPNSFTFCSFYSMGWKYWQWARKRSSIPRIEQYNQFYYAVSAMGFVSRYFSIFRAIGRRKMWRYFQKNDGEYALTARLSPKCPLIFWSLTLSLISQLLFRFLDEAIQS